MAEAARALNGPLFADLPGDLAVSFEFFPPKTPAMHEALWQAVDTLVPLGPRFFSVTYGAGGFKVTNAAANAWAEQVPLLIISGAPGMAEREGDPLLHHKVKGFDTQFNVFRELTCAQAVLSSPHNAADEIDRVIRTMLSQQRPGYIEVPRDMVMAEIDASRSTIDPSLPFLDPVALEEALADVMSELSRASTAVIHAGAMVERRHVESDLISFAMTAGIPVATSSLARGVFPERHPLGLGVYLGALSPENVVRRVEDADILLSLGVLQTDLTLGAFTANLDHKREVLCSDTDVTVGYRTYKGVPLWAFLPALNAALGGKALNISHESDLQVQVYFRFYGFWCFFFCVAVVVVCYISCHFWYVFCVYFIEFHG
jgi:indolepyruvate decarboxylase